MKKKFTVEPQLKRKSTVEGKTINLDSSDNYDIIQILSKTVKMVHNQTVSHKTENADSEQKTIKGQEKANKFDEVGSRLSWWPKENTGRKAAQKTIPKPDKIKKAISKTNITEIKTLKLTLRHKNG